MTIETLYAVRANFRDLSGTADHEFIYGIEPTVFDNEPAAKRHAAKLQVEAVSKDWGQVSPPAYYVEPISESDMWEAEEISDEDDRDEIQKRIDDRLTEENIEKLLAKIEQAIGRKLVEKDNCQNINEDVRVWVCDTFASDEEQG